MSDPRSAKDFIREMRFPTEDLDKRVGALEGYEGQSYILIRDEKANNTPGGTFNNGAWRTRNLTTIVVDTGGYATLAANQITLQPGVYRFCISAPAYNCAEHKVRFYDITGATTVEVGSNSFASNVSHSRSFVHGQFTITSENVYEVQHRCSVSRAGDGFGLESNFSVIEVYTIAEFWRGN